MIRLLSLADYCYRDHYNLVRSWSWTWSWPVTVSLSLFWLFLWLPSQHTITIIMVMLINSIIIIMSLSSIIDLYSILDGESFCIISITSIVKITITVIVSAGTCRKTTTPSMSDSASSFILHRIAAGPRIRNPNAHSVTVIRILSLRIDMHATERCQWYTSTLLAQGTSSVCDYD